MVLQSVALAFDPARYGICLGRGRYEVCGTEAEPVAERHADDVVPADRLHRLLERILVAEPLWTAGERGGGCASRVAGL